MVEGINAFGQAETTFTVEEVLELLIKKKNMHEGYFSLALQLQVAIGGIGFTPTETFPGAMLGVTGFSLTPAEQLGPLVLDAAIVNPKKPPRKEKQKTS